MKLLKWMKKNQMKARNKMPSTTLPGKPTPVSNTSPGQNQTEKKYDVFVSYSHREGDWVENELLPRLKRAQFKVAIDINLLQAGDDLGILQEELTKSRVLLPIFSPNYFSSDYAPRELETALKLKDMERMSIVPILLRGRESIPQEFRRLQFFDFSIVFKGEINKDEAERIWGRLLDAIRSEIDRNQDFRPVDSSFPPNVSESQNVPQNTKPPESVSNSAETPPPDTDKKETLLSEKTEVQVKGRAVSDAVSQEDLLGFADYVEALAQFLESKETQKPLTIGIDAPWGVGKSTLMRMLEKRLGPKPIEGARRWQKKQTDGFFNVWFNAWKYDAEESLWGALVLEILEQVGKQLGWWRRTKIWFSLNKQRFDWLKLSIDIAAALGFVLVLGIVGAIALFGLSRLLGLSLYDTVNIWLRHYTKIFAALGLVSVLYEIAKDFLTTFVSPFSLGVAKYIKSPDYKTKVGFIGQFQEDFKAVIDTVTESGKWPLIVFIDDLDRCTPAKAASVIEAINLLLDSEYCIFIIGMNAQILSMSIQAKYKDLQELFKEAEKPVGPNLGRHFLEKIIQIDFRVPTPDEEHINIFIDAQLGIRKKPEEQKSPEQIIAESLIQAEIRDGKELPEASQSVKQATPELKPDDIKKAENEIKRISFEEFASVRSASRFVAKYLDYNPRQIKRFINMFRLQSLIAYQREALEQENGIELSQLANWILISMRWPDFFEAALLDINLPIRFINGAQEYAKTLKMDATDRDDFLRLLPEDIAHQKDLFTDDELLEVLGKLNLQQATAARYLKIGWNFGVS
jgi:hypothetical protein